MSMSDDGTVGPWLREWLIKYPAPPKTGSTPIYDSLFVPVCAICRAVEEARQARELFDRTVEELLRFEQKLISHENSHHPDSNISGENMNTTPNTGAPYHIPLLESAPLAPLIGLGGKLRAGKDAVGDYLEEHHGYTKLGMSDALNEALLALNPYVPTERIHAEGDWVVPAGIHRYQDLHDAVGYVEAKKNPEVRRLLQMLGTEVGRNMIDPDVWVNIAVRKITELREAGKPVVITAVRFPNEVEMIRRLGGTTVWIERPTEARTDAQGDILTHASETSVDAGMFDWTIQNDSTLEELYRSADMILDLSTPMGGHELPQRFGSNVTS